MFERFSRDARAAVVGARDIALALGHDQVSAQHLLVALCDGGGVAARVLQRFGVETDAVSTDLASLGRSDAQALSQIGVDLDAVRRQVEASFGPGALDRPTYPSASRARSGLLGEHVSFSADAKKAMEQALREARALRHDQIGTEHILLALFANGSGPVMGALRRLGMSGDYGTVKAAVLEELVPRP